MKISYFNRQPALLVLLIPSEQKMSCSTLIERQQVPSSVLYIALWLSEIKHSSCTPPPQSINNIALWFLLAGFISSFPVFDEILSTFSVVKATLQSQMSVHSFICPSVCLSGSKTPQTAYNQLHHTFITTFTTTFTTTLSQPSSSSFIF